MHTRQERWQVRVHDIAKVEYLTMSVALAEPTPGEEAGFLCITSVDRYSQEVARLVLL